MKARINFLLKFLIFLAPSVLMAQNGSGFKYGIVDAWQYPYKESTDTQRKFRIGKILSVKIANLDGWIMEEVAAKRLNAAPFLTSEQRDEIESHLKALEKGEANKLDPATCACITEYNRFVLSRLYPVVNGIDIPKPVRYGVIPVHSDNKDTIHIIRFLLDRNSSDNPAWKKLLKTSEQSLRINLTLGFVDKDNSPPRQLPSIVGGDDKDSGLVLEMELYDFVRVYVVAAIILVMLGFLLWFTPDSDILRDTTQPIGRDGRHPWSLSRAQMAFWFILVVSSFLFVWGVTEQLVEIGKSSLALIGIGSATALGVAAVSNSQRDEPAIAAAARLYSSRRIQTWKDLKKKAIAGADGFDASDKDFFNRRRMTKLLEDWMTENGVVSFHRFQILAWTLALGVVYLDYTLHQLELPDLDVTLLALTGISAGTYVGFKFPPTRPIPGN